MLWLLFLTASPSVSCFASECRTALHQQQNFISLTVESTGWSAELTWNASFDKDLIDFAIQRSSNGINYEDIIRYNPYFVAAGDIQTFREQDPDPMKGENFYRIRVTLADGEQVFSERCKIYFKEIAAFEIYPNPTGRQVNLLLKKFKGETVEIVILDGIGEQVYEQHIFSVDDGIFRIELDVMNPGIYAVSVVHNGKTYTRRLVVTKADG
ncbi:MAG: T9SS type A sorting domain-containing protein [Saprospiraceae bacterium]|nr:T9SS type A sorting domain-containing protein [Saprospiraceae bacterium]